MEVKKVHVDEDVTPSRAADEVVADDRQPTTPTVLEGGSIRRPERIPPSHFFDPERPEQEPEIVLRRVRQDEFMLTKPLAYWDESRDQVIIVPANLEKFTTDLTSVPRLFTWLVPRTGIHLPAAILHDGLVHGPDEEATYIADTEIPRAEADRIFRDAMRQLGATWARRWLIWATVLVATLVSGSSRTRWRVTVAATALTIVVLGSRATLDLLDCSVSLPWMGDRATWLEFAYGAGMAIVISAALALLWIPTWDGRPVMRWSHWRAGFIFGVALALLLHVTVAVTLVYCVFTAVESLIDRRVVRSAMFAGGAAVIIGVVTLAALRYC